MLEHYKGSYDGEAATLLVGAGMSKLDFNSYACIAAASLIDAIR
jgi:hypothetical protein